jgi:hypothetical protein
MKLGGKLIIHVDQSVKSVDIQHMNVDKQNIMDKAKSSMEKQFMAQRSTGFRT